jgi:hypothetical protein
MMKPNRGNSWHGMPVLLRVLGSQLSMIGFQYILFFLASALRFQGIHGVGFFWNMDCLSLRLGPLL